MAEIAKIVQGNNFNIAIPLKVYILNEGEVVLQDYTPAEGDDVTIRLVGERRGYTYKPTTEGNVAHLQLSGHEVCDTYAVEVIIIGSDGTMLRSYRGDQLAIVYNVDTIIADGAVEDGELYLDSQFFIQGEKGEQGDPGQDGTDGTDGRGIVSVTKTATQGLVDTYTITYTDGTTSTFEVTNGQSGGGGEDFFVNVTRSGGVYVADKTLQECITAFSQGLQVVFTMSGGTGIVENYIAVRRLSTYYSGQYYRTIWAFGVNGSVVQILKYDDSGITLSLAPAIIDNLTSSSTTSALSANQGKVLKGLVDAKQDTLVSGTTIKTINSASLLGSGDIAVATPTDLATYCPIIEDTRSSAVAAITGVAPFASLADGQRIVLRLKYNMINNSTLSLNGGTAYNLIKSSKNAVDRLWAGEVRANSCIEFVFDAANNRWVMVGQADSNTTYATISQADIDTGTGTTAVVVTPKRLCDNFQKLTKVETLPSGAIAPTDGYEPNKMYDFGKVATVTFAAYDTSKEISGCVNLYMCTFVVASGGTTLNLNANIKYPNGDDGTELTNLLTTEDRVFEVTIRRIVVTENNEDVSYYLLSYLYFD